MKHAHDFSSWKRDNLEKLAADLTNELLKIKAENEQLKLRNQKLLKNIDRIQSHEPAFNKMDRHFPEDDGC